MTPVLAEKQIFYVYIIIFTLNMKIPSNKIKHCRLKDSLTEIR